VAVEAMALTRGGRGRVVYMPTVDAEYRSNPGTPGKVRSRATDNCCRKCMKSSRSWRNTISACPPDTSVRKRS
jgi:hypothetical protein